MYIYIERENIYFEVEYFLKPKFLAIYNKDFYIFSIILEALKDFEIHITMSLMICSLLFIET